MNQAKGKVVPALLRYWRGVRGMSQLDLATAADVSSRHVSFLETGRANPSREMILRLGATLDIPMREQNTLLVAAGFSEAFRDSELGDLDPYIRDALQRMMTQQEPYPLTVMDRHYNLVMANASATRFLGLVMGNGLGELTELNIMKLVFDPKGFRSVIGNWEELAKGLLSRLQREAIHQPGDRGLAELLATLLGFPGIPADWRSPDLTEASGPTLNVTYDIAGQRLSFLTTLTVFNAPQNVTLEELRIESHFPLDDATERACVALAG